MPIRRGESGQIYLLINGWDSKQGEAEGASYEEIQRIVDRIALDFVDHGG
jgi:hypothetical protein